MNTTFSNIPAVLREIPHWVCWRSELRPCKDGALPKKPTKVPYNPRTGKKARSNGPETWSAFSLAEAAFNSSGGDAAATKGYDGIGFMFTEDMGMVGGDLDNCLDPDTLEAAPWAKEIIDRVNTYTEITPSMTGLRFVCHAKLPEGGNRKDGVELYSKLRFLTFTGNRWPSSPETINEAQAAIDAVHANYVAPASPPEENPPGPLYKGELTPSGETPEPRNGNNGHHSITAEQVYEGIRNAKNGAAIKALLDGHWQGKYKSQSEADSALCHHLAFYCGGDVMLMDQIFRHSGLMRPKWDETHGERAYGIDTITKACGRVKKYYRPPSPGMSLKPSVMRGEQARHYIETGASEADNPENDERIIAPKHPYGIKDGRIYFASEKAGKNDDGVTTTFTTVCDLTAHITHEITTEGGDRHFRVEGRTAPTPNRRHGIKFQLEIAAVDFADERKLKAALTNAAGAQSVVRKGMNGHVAPAIQLLSGELVQARRFTRTGWDLSHGKSTFLIPGREPEHTTIELPRKLPYSVTADANLDQGLQALGCLFNAQETPMATVAATAAFQAPLANLCGWRNERYAVFIAGRTGSLKSSWAQVLMCLYGPDFMNDDQLIKWGEGATRNAIMSFATHMHDMPLLLDNYKSIDKNSNNGFVNLIHNIMEGGEKDRLTRTSTLRDSRPVFAWPIITGENVPNVDAAALARMLVIPFPFPRKNENPQLTAAQEFSTHLCAVGAAWLDFLESEAGRETAQSIAKEFNDRRTHWMKHLRQVRQDIVNINRVASNLATNELTWRIMRECPALQTLINDYSGEHEAGLVSIAGEMASQTAESLEASRYLSALCQLLYAEDIVLNPYGVSISQHDIGRVIGWQDSENAYLMPDKARQAVDKLLGSNGLGEIPDKTIHQQLKSLGILKEYNGTRTQKRITIGKEKPWTLCIPLKALYRESNNEED